MNRPCLGLRIVVAVCVVGLGVVGCGGGGGGGGVQAGAVTGRVLDDQGEPVVGAQVVVGGVAGVTDTSGNYSVAGVAVGAQTVTITMAGYQFTAVAVTVEAGQSTSAGTSTGARVSERPSVALTVTPAGNLTFVGGNVNVRAVVTDADSTDLEVRGSLQVNGSDGGGTFNLTRGDDGAYTASLALDANSTTTDVVYTIFVTASDGLNFERASQTVTVEAILSPSDVDGGSGAGGGPPVPSI